MNHHRPSPLIHLALTSLLFTFGCGDDGTAAPSGESGTIDVQISGEELATDGLLFPDGSEVTIADGWEIEFTHVLVTIDKITLSENPDLAPSDQSETGSVVAEAIGPWAIDVHQEGIVTAAGGEGMATPITTIENENKKGGAAFDPTQRYAFGYDIVEASADATLLNFADDSDATAAYEHMVAKGYGVMYVGTATFKGEGCETGDPGYDFGALPATLDFEIGFATPSSYINCQNQENQGDPFPDEEYQRGIPIIANAASVAQITLHVDHPFYSDVEHEPALYFDQMAAQLVGKADGTTLGIDDFVGVDPTAFTDGNGDPLPPRVCDGSDLPSGTQKHFEVGSVPLDPSGDPTDALRDYRDYVHYVQSTQGHLNGGEGLCFVKRNYPSPP